jgi:lysophospholipase L1-like esterase
MHEYIVSHHNSQPSIRSLCVCDNTIPSMAARPKILLLGDSLTQLGWDGWVGQLAHVYQRRADVVNRGMSGYNTKWFLEYAKTSDVWLQGTVALVVIFFGANDSSDAILNPRHHIPPDEFKQNLEKLVQLCEEHYGKDVGITIVTAPPVVHHQRLMFQKERFGDKATGELERTMELSELYAQAALDVAFKVNRPSIHLWKVMQEDENWESFFIDGLHFSAQGNDFVARAILSQVMVSNPHLFVHPCPTTQQWANAASRCEALLHDGPYHEEIDHTNHMSAFQEHRTR